MKKLWIIATLVGLMAFSCEKEDCTFLGNTCAVNNPTEELPWLKAEIQQREQSTSDVAQYFYIAQAEYKDETIFMYNNCCPMCNTMVPVYNCQGELLFYLSQQTEESKYIKNTKVIWKPANFACNID